MKARAENLVFILVRPTYLGNIGSIARVLKNFGLSQLRLVDPPRNYKDAEARRMSAGAFDILKHAQVYENLSDALKDIAIAIGTTAGHHRAKAPEAFSRVKNEIVLRSQSNRIAWVFGDERNGLSKEEVQRCHRTVTLPVRADFPSLNVAQAVGLIAYEMSSGELETAGEQRDPNPTGEQDDELISQLEDLLDRLEFTRTYNRQVILKELRGLYQRMLPTQREHELFREVIRRVRIRLGGLEIEENDRGDAKHR
jgi:TrmH family RNA methyltransferase